MSSGITTILLGLAEQMYEDVRFITEHSPTQVVDDDTARMFNSLLAEVRVNAPGVVAVVKFGDMSPRTLKYKDALVVVGQLRTMLRISTQTDVSRIARESMRRVMENESLDESLDEEESPSSSARTSRDTVPSSDRVVHDPELYGTAPVVTNPDGTVPFALDDGGDATDAFSDDSATGASSLRDESDPDYRAKKVGEKGRVQQTFPLRDR